MTHYWGECLTIDSAYNQRITLFFFPVGNLWGWQRREREREKRRERNGEKEKRK